MFRQDPPVLLPLVLSLDITEKQPISVLQILSLQVFIYINKIPLSPLFSRLSSPSFLGHFLYERCFIPLVIFVALCWTVSRMSVHLIFAEEPRTGHGTPDTASLGLKGTGSLPLSCWQCSSYCSTGCHCLSSPQGEIVGSWANQCSPGPSGPSLQNCLTFRICKMKSVTNFCGYTLDVSTVITINFYVILKT